MLRTRSHRGSQCSTLTIMGLPSLIPRAIVAYQPCFASRRFLTQTRPDVGSPEIYRAPSPTQGIAFNQPSEPQSSTRHPLRTISLSDDVDFGSPARLNRLRERATTPTSPLLGADYKTSPSHSPSVARPVNVFDEMKRAAKARAERPKRKLERSEFIEQEAQESDDDEMFGFGPREKDKDDEGDGEDLDKTLDTCFVHDG